MRIGIMCHSSFGGSSRIGVNLAIQLAKRAHKIHLFTRTTPFGYWDDSITGVCRHQMIPDIQNTIPLTHLHTNWSIQEMELILAQIMKVIAARGLDILNFHYALPFAFLAVEIKKRLGSDAPLLIGTLHGSDVSIHGRHPTMGPHLSQTLKQMDKLTTVSIDHAHLASRIFKLSFLPEVIPNFIDHSEFNPSIPYKTYPGSRNRGPATRSRPKIVHVSNFRPVKDARKVAHIFIQIRHQLDAELWLVGDGPELQAVKSILEQSGFEKDVYYWGLQTDVAAILTQADLMLITSIAESFSLTALEAMACGVPVLATLVGGIPEVVIHGETGYLFSLDDHEAAVGWAVGILSDPVQLQTLKAAAAQHAKRFGNGRIVPHYEDMYHRVIEGAAP